MAPKRLFFLIVLVFLSGCGTSGEQAAPAASPTAALRYYQTPTPTAYSPTPTLEFQPTSPALPTPTPMVYTVVEGDTLIGIAVRFGVTLEEILAANPGVDPRLLTIGTPLLIPHGEEGTGVANLPTPTPLPLSEEGILCYANAAGGLWCFWQVQNDREEAIENVSALINLYDAEGQLAASGVALSPLNLLRPGERIPLLVYFAPPVPDWAGVYGDILTSIPLPEDSERYLNTVINDLSVEVSGGGLQAHVQGRVTLEDRQQEAGLLWVAAVAYDAQNHVVGVRRWESGEGIEAGETQSFELWVYSLGPAIQRVEVFAEARP